MRKARILYVSSTWTGLYDFFFKKGQPQGMPAFVRPLTALLQRGHDVDLLLTSSEGRIDPDPAPILSKCDVQVVPWSNANPITQWWSVLRVWKRMDAMLAKRRYDFVYCHGAASGTAGNLRALRWKIPCGLRLYGTVLGMWMKQMAVATTLKRWKYRATAVNWSTLEMVGWRIPKKFLLITHDGSGGEMVFQRHGTKRYQFHHWRNGISLPEATSGASVAPVGRSDRPFILYVARIQQWKRQDRILNILRQLRDAHGMVVNAVFVGQIHPQNREYHAELLQRIESMGLRDQVEFTGSIPSGAVNEFYTSPHCLCAGSLYDWCNLGNAALEAVANGKILLGAGDGSLDGIVSDGVSGYLVRDDVEAAQRIMQLIESPARRAAMQAAAARLAAERLETWDSRVEREVGLVESALA